MATTCPALSRPHHTPPSSTVTVIAAIATSPREALPCNGGRVRSRLFRARSTAASSLTRVRSSVPVARITGAPVTDSATAVCRADRSRRARSKRRAITRCRISMTVIRAADSARTGRASCQL